VSDQGGVDVIVVGAGLSGLACARRLVAAGKTVRVLEARNRVGGRLLTGDLAGAPIDLGGQWLSAGQDRVIALVGELGIATTPQRRDGAPRVVAAPTDFIGKVATAWGLWRGTRRLSRMARAIPPGRAEEARDAAALDATTLAAWLDDNVRDAAARDQLAMHASLVCATEPARLSLLDYLATLDATGAFAPRGRDLPGGGREHRCVEGAQVIAHRLAEQIGDALTLGAEVRGLRDDGAGVDVLGVGARARRVVLAVPPACARRLDVGWAPAQRRYLDAMSAGGVVKCFAAYPRAFWRDAGGSGEIYHPGGVVRAAVALGDGSPGGGPAALLGFIVGDAAAGWAARPPDERRGLVLAAFAEAIGDEALTPRAYVEHDWTNEPWSLGAVTSLPPGARTAGARWREAHGRIHIAGTESAIAWPGYMEGALEAGERAAAEVLKAEG
jgi:monoamine oxidase